MKKRYYIIRVISLIITVTLLLTISFSSAQSLSKIGSQGEEVRQIQLQLKNLGYFNDKIDGIYGKQTKEAVIKFQMDNNLIADGIAGTKTLEKLNITSNSSPNIFTESEISLLARIISAESRGEPYEGQVAVGAVILNRIDHPSFPNTLAGVIYQPSAFTCVTDGQINENVSDSSKKAAQDALNGWDPTGGAIYYYNPAKTTNKWIYSRPVITTIGKHKFCL
ncbi:MAG: spore cortex-lytic enzyme [Acutalibacteraceae bacterium]|nr:spore cortex-lytic enzyme [Acutalibacteraceae bacterium]